MTIISTTLVIFEDTNFVLKVPFRVMLVFECPMEGEGRKKRKSTQNKDLAGLRGRKEV